MLLIKAAARGFGVWVTYIAVGTLFSWLCLAVSLGTIWRGEDGGLAHAAHAGPIVLLLLLLRPQFWATALFLFGFPSLAVVLGQGMGLRAALQRVLRAKVSLLSDTALRVVWPVCTKLTAQRGTGALRDMARAIDQSIQENSSGALRWLLRKVTSLARLPALLAGGEFIEQVRSQPEQARVQVRARIEAEVSARTQGGVFRALVMLLAGTALSTIAVLTAWPL
jgi:hypothetical protein